ncbi:hypothetical protein CDAR_183881 [Caerostris darwini]|uniref:Uncharacterized protein n=1 Tax=Caerostris darwini TaxID=1538125 RepID=A0AAV4TXN8_9ARAC|nr:hypothetical protein CDAR_183881 [Caerostris darwini]
MSHRIPSDFKRGQHLVIRCRKFKRYQSDSGILCLTNASRMSKKNSLSNCPPPLSKSRIPFSIGYRSLKQKISPSRGIPPRRMRRIFSEGEDLPDPILPGSPAEHSWRYPARFSN